MIMEHAEREAVILPDHQVGLAEVRAFGIDNIDLSKRIAIEPVEVAREQSRINLLAGLGADLAGYAARTEPPAPLHADLADLALQHQNLKNSTGNFLGRQADVNDCVGLASHEHDDVVDDPVAVLLRQRLAQMSGH